MKLDAFLQEQGMSLKDFSAVSKVSMANLSRYRKKRRKPDLENMAKIRKATRYRVDVEDFLDD